LSLVYKTSNKGGQRDRTKPSTVGLSAPQVGWLKQVSVVDMAITTRQFHDVHILINPTIIKQSKAMVERIEGCVNFQDMWGPVSRARTVTVGALDRSGNKLTIEASGWTAVLLQHEIDHLNGILFIDHLADPTKAHHVQGEQYKDYNKKSAADWPHKIDVSRWLNRQKVGVGK
jgi:peptide deformylase